MNIPNAVSQILYIIYYEEQVAAQAEEAGWKIIDGLPVCGLCLDKASAAE
jgi:hypothetical protein